MGDYVDDMAPEIESAAALFKSLSHPSRLLICCQLLDGPMGVSELEERLSLKQPNLSRELAKLRTENVANSTRVGGAVTYELADERVRWVLEAYRSQGQTQPTVRTTGFAKLNGQAAARPPSGFQGGGAMFARTFTTAEDV